jgi:hypothetical protein
MSAIRTSATAETSVAPRLSAPAAPPERWISAAAARASPKRAVASQGQEQRRTKLRRRCHENVSKLVVTEVPVSGSFPLRLRDRGEQEADVRSLEPRQPKLLLCLANDCAAPRMAQLGTAEGG